MRILHTSDWHIGRTFHGEPVLDNLALALDRLHEQVREHGVEVVCISGDIFDSTVPSAKALQFFDARLAEFVDDGARVLVTAGNHDSAARLGYLARWLGESGIHIFSDPSRPAEFIELQDASGPVRFYGIPYLEPAIVRSYADGDQIGSQRDAIAWAMGLVRESMAEFDGRVVVLAHCFAAGVPDTGVADDIERDLSAGGIDVVPLELFEGVSYVALGHIHSRSRLSERVRYSGAPLHYSFGEANQPRGSWLIDLGGAGEGGADDGAGDIACQWLELPVPRPLVELTGTLQELETDAEFAAHTESWVSARLTDTDRPVDAMRRLRQRFPHAVHLEYVQRSTTQQARRTLPRATSPEQHTDAFLKHVREAQGLTRFENGVLTDLLSEIRKQEAER